MTQAFNLSQLANNLNTSGQLDATDGLTGAVPVANGGTGATSASTARTNLGLGTLSTLSPSGTASSSTYLRGDNTWATVSSGGVTSLNGQTGAITNTSYNVIGSYVSGIGNAGAGVGATFAGSTISVFSTGTSASPIGSSAGTLSGTWRQMGAIGQSPASSKSYYKISLYVRIS